MQHIVMLTGWEGHECDDPRDWRLVGENDKAIMQDLEEAKSVKAFMEKDNPNCFYEVFTLVKRD
jgi:hypothetical protein